MVKIIKIKKGSLVRVRSEEWHNRNTWLYVRLGYILVSKLRGWRWRRGNDTRAKYWGVVTAVLEYNSNTHFARLACDNGLHWWHVCDLEEPPTEKDTKKRDSV